MVKNTPLYIIFAFILAAPSLEAQKLNLFEDKQDIRTSINRHLTPTNRNLGPHYQKNVSQANFLNENSIANDEVFFDSVVAYKFNGINDSLPISKKDNASGITFLFDAELGEWVKSDSSYVEDNQATRSQIYGSYKWDKSQNKWLHATKEEIHYNETEDILLREGYFKNGLGEWQGTFKDVFSYYEKDRFDSIVTYQWDLAQGSWTGRTKYKYLYNEDLTITSRITYDFNPWSNDWVEVDRSRVEKIIKEGFSTFINYRWHLGEWHLATKDEVTIDASGNTTLSINYEYNSIDQSWEQYSKYELVISEGTRTGSFYSWNPETNEWDIQNTQIKKYNEDNLMISDEYYYFHDNGDMVGSHFRQWVYDFDGFGSRIDISYKWNEGSSDWDVDTKHYRFKNKTIIAGVDDYPIHDLIYYPNPVIDGLNIHSSKEEIEEVSLYSSSGKLLAVKRNLNKKSCYFPFDNYSSGSYFLKVKTNRSAETYRIVK